MELSISLRNLDEWHSNLVLTLNDVEIVGGPIVPEKDSCTQEVWHAHDGVFFQKGGCASTFDGIRSARQVAVPVCCREPIKGVRPLWEPIKGVRPL